MARWDEASRARCRQTRLRLANHLAGHIPPSCTHLKGHGGVKGAIRTLTAKHPGARFVARFDIARYYKSMRHDVLLSELRATGAGPEDVAVVREYSAVIADVKSASAATLTFGSLRALRALRGLRRCRCTASEARSERERT